MSESVDEKMGLVEWLRRLNGLKVEGLKMVERVEKVEELKVEGLNR